MPDQNGIEIRWILAALRRWIWLIAGCALLAAVVAVLVTALVPPSYEATAGLLIQPAQDTRSTEYNALIAGERLALTYSEMLKGRPVLDTVISQTNLEETSDELAERVTAQPVRDTQMIRLSVKDPSPEQAVVLANGIAQAFIEYIQTLQSQRYAGSLQNMQAKLDTLTAQIDEVEARIQPLKTTRRQ